MSIRPTRRLFFSAAVAAPLAAAAPALAAKPAGDDLAARLARLEDQEALRTLQAAYVTHVNAQARAELTVLFAEAEEAHSDVAIRSLTGEPATDGIQIAVDGTTAIVRGTFVVATETPIDGTATVLEMARLQGDGVVRKSERRTLEIAAVKVDGVWKIERTSWAE